MSALGHSRPGAAGRRLEPCPLCTESDRHPFSGPQVATGQKQTHALQHDWTVKSVTDPGLEACYRSLRCSGHDPIGGGSNGSRYR
jgi:hypothetical protein